MSLVATGAFILALSPDISAFEPSPDRRPLSAEALELKRLAQLESQAGPLSRRLQHIKHLKSEAAAKGLPLTPEVVYATLPVIVGDFTDEVNAFTPAEYQDFLFGNNPTGNMTDYFMEVSYGQFNLTGTVYGTFTADESMAYYASDAGGFNSNFPNNGAGFVWSLLDDADAVIDFSLWDNDGPDGVPNSGDDDGTVLLSVICAGGASQPNAFRSHAWSLTGGGSGSPYVTADAAYGGGFIEINGYVLQTSEKGDGTLDEFRGIGVFVHEYGHKLGLPDQYDDDYTSNGVGRWCLMGYGSGGAQGNNITGHRPTHLCAWCKADLGWVIPTVVSGTESVSIPPVETNQVIYKLWDDAFQSGRYFLLENRVAAGFDADIAGEGVLIWHCNDEVGWSNLDETWPILHLEEADGLAELTSRLSFMDAGDPFPGAAARTVFSDFTVPSTHDYFGAPTGVRAESFAYASGPGSNVNVTLTQRDIYGYTLAYIEAHGSFGWWGYVNPQVTYGACRFTTSEGGRLVGGSTAQFDAQPMPYTLRIFSDMVAGAPSGLLYQSSGDLPDVYTDRYFDIPIESALDFTSEQTLVVDIARGPDDRAVPVRSSGSWSAESYFSGDGSSYFQFTDWEVLVKARIATSCADTDVDGVCAYLDNCPDEYNPSQTDTDNDGLGDLCDLCPADNVNNPAPTDFDGNLVADACECGRPGFIFSGGAAEDWLGWRVAGAGDVNGDGFEDIILGARYDDEAAANSGKAYIFSGENGNLLYEFSGEAATDNFGQTVAGAGDVNNDGYADVVVGAYGCDLDGENAGRAYVFHGGAGPFPVFLSASAADLIFTGEAPGDNMGWDVAGLKDIDGDDCSELIIAAPQRGTSLEGLVYVFSGQTGGKLYTFTGEYPLDWFGYGIDDAGDVNNDGLNDVVVGAFANDVNGSASGSVYVFYSGPGPYPTTTGAAAADMTLAGDFANHALGSSVAGMGDLNGDGHDDFVVGAYFRGPGYAYVYSGLDGSRLLSVAGMEPGDRFGWAVSGAGDIDADGFPDLVVGAPKAFSGGIQTGRAYVISGQIGQVLKAVSGEADGDAFGRDVWAGVDANGDGVGDLLVGAYASSADHFEAGRAYLFHLGSDSDGDNVLAGCDNCISTYNPDQSDSDADGIGDVCDGCCVARVGDANGQGGDEPTISDISTLIDAKFITGTCEGKMSCLAEADVNQSGGADPTCGDITISDISSLIDYLFITGPESATLPDCL